MCLKPLRRLCILFCLVSSCTLGVDEVLTRPAPANPERSRILDAARVKVAEDLGHHNSGTLKFIVNHLCVLGNWAFLDATPATRASGKLIPLERNCIEGEDYLDNLTVLLLQRTDKGWKPFRGGSLCAGDVPWIEWGEELKGVVPDAIFRCPEVTR